MMERAGFIGLGIMGRPMALHLLKGGAPLCVYARKPEMVAPLTAGGAVACISPAEVAEKSGIVFICVSDTPDVEDVIFGENGLVHGLRPGSVVVDMSTISQQATRDFARRLQEKGIFMLDAPVSGGEAGAINATLSIMIGGEVSIVDRVMPFFRMMGKNIVHIGESGAGQVAKSCNQVIVAVTIEAVAESLRLAERSGVDPARVREALLGGFAASKILEVHGKRMLENDFRPGFTARLHYKDLRIVRGEASALGVDLPAVELVARRLQAVIESGDAELDSSVLFRQI